MKRNNYNRIALLLFFLGSFLPIHAQIDVESYFEDAEAEQDALEEPDVPVCDRPTQERNLQILFIDHEASMPSTIISHLRKCRREADESENSLIIYMPNGDEPFIAVHNLRDYDGVTDTEDAFDAICEALNQASHNKNPREDRKNILDLLDKYKVIDDNNQLQFRAVRMAFYLTSDFWKLGYHKSIVPPIAFALGVQDLYSTDQDFYFDVYINPEDKPEFDDPQKPFGNANLGDINSWIAIYDYNF